MVQKFQTTEFVQDIKQLKKQHQQNDNTASTYTVAKASLASFKTFI